MTSALALSTSTTPAAILLPAVSDTGWFFDTELLITAQRQGLRIHEVAVDWTEDPDSRVDIVATAVADLRGVTRLLFKTPRARRPRRRPALKELSFRSARTVRLERRCEYW